MYEVIAGVYDLFMDDDSWIDFAVKAVKGKYRGADVGCGSGNVTLALAKEHDVVAIDNSDDMLRVAREKFRRSGLAIPVVKQRAEKLKLPFKAQFITAMCDVVNYIESPITFFASAYENLDEGGLLVFDMSSESKLRETLGNNVYSETKNDITYVWENCLKRNKVEMTLTFFLPAKEGLYEKAIDRQTQYIHSAKDIADALEMSGFSYKITDCGDRIYFVAKKGTNG